MVVVATTDVHGRAMHWDYVADREAPWGLTRAATAIDSLRRAFPGRVLVVDAGDLIQGEPFAAFHALQPLDPHPVIDAMNVIGYDAITPGNHEFNFGLDLLSRVYGAAAFPIVSGNVFRLPRDTYAWQPWTMIRRGPVSVGVTGFTTPGSMIWDRRNLAGRMVVRPIEPAAERILPAMRDAGAELRVVVIHSGMDGPSSYDTTGVGPENVAARLAHLSVRPHLVVVGHSHRQIRDSVINGVHFIQPLPWARGLAVAHVWLVREANGFRVIRIMGQQVPLADVPPSTVLTRRLERAHQAVRNLVNAPIAPVEGDFSARYGRVRDTPVIRFVNEVQRRASGAQLSATAAFNTDVELGPGAVRLRHLYGLYPYENTLTAVRIDGESLRRFLEHSARYFRTYEPGRPLINDSVPGYNFDIVSGVEYDIDLRNPVGERITRLMYRGREVLPSDTFTLALNNYRQGGGGGYDMVARLPVVYDSAASLRDLLAGALRDTGTLRVDPDFREQWRIVPDEARAAAIAHFAPPEAPARDSTLVRLLVTGGIMGRLEPALGVGGRRAGGPALLAAWMDSLAARCRCASVRLDIGHNLMGSQVADASRGRVMVEAFNAAGYSAARVAGADLILPADTLRARAAESEYQWLAANVTGGDGQRPPWLEPWVLLEPRGARVAVLGVTESGAGLAGGTLDAGDPVQAVRRLVPATRATGADALVVLAPNGQALARQLDSAAVHVIITPGGVPVGPMVINGITVIGAPLEETEVVQADVIRRADGRIEVRVLRVTAWADSVEPTARVRAVVQSHTQALREVLGREIARLRVPFRAGEVDGPLGRLVADALRAATRTDVSIVPVSTMRDELEAGVVVYGDLRRVLGDSDNVVTVTVTGAMLLELVEDLLAGDSPSADIAGLSVSYDPRRPEGRRIRDVRLADGRRVDRRRSYSLSLPASASPGITGLADRGESTGLLSVDAVAAYLPRLPQPVDATGSPRWNSTR